jgi:SAM-dependent methyltransferase
MSQPSARERLFSLLRDSLAEDSFVKLTLGKPAPTRTDATLHNVFVRPVALKTGPHLTFVFRHATRDVTKNYTPADALDTIESLLGLEFLDAHLFTAAHAAQLETQPDGSARVRVKAQSSTHAPAATATPASHNQPKHYLIPADSPWLESLGVLNNRGQPRDGMADKFRQIQKFAELLQHLVAEAFPASSAPASDSSPSSPDSQLSALSSQLRVVDAGSGKGYLTFALAALLGEGAHVTGIEARPELVTLCNRVAAQHALAHRLTFRPGTINDTPLITPAPSPALSSQLSTLSTSAHLDLLIALHACDTATDDALARGIAAGARLLVVSPCCQKEIRPQLTAPPVLADALRQGIFQERQAEFVTDALRAQLLEWAGYKTKVFEFISTEHTAKNLMISAIRVRPPGTPNDALAQRTRAFAAFYGIRHHALATHLNFALHV